MGAAPTSPPSARVPGLDALRALAIVWVVLCHSTSFALLPTGSPWIDDGWMAVDLFFALSGYLIGGQLFRAMAAEGRLDLAGFYGRRAFRTLPAYAAVTALYFAVPAWRDRAHIAPLWQFATFTENLFVRLPPGKAFSHVWSLCVEEQFYLLFPFIVLLLGRRPSARKAIFALAAVLVGGLAVRAGVWAHDLAPLYTPGEPTAAYNLTYMERIYYPTWTRLDGLLFGACVAAVEVWRPRLWAALARRADLVLAVGVGLVLCACVLFKDQCPGPLGAVLGYPALALGMALVVCAGASPHCTPLRRPIPGARPLALMSYSLYLSHKLLLHWAQVHFAVGFDAPFRPLPAIAAWLAALAVGAALYLLVERPFLELRGRILARRSRARPAQTEPELAKAA